MSWSHTLSPQLIFAAAHDRTFDLCHFGVLHGIHQCVLMREINTSAWDATHRSQDRHSIAQITRTHRLPVQLCKPKAPMGKKGEGHSCGLSCVFAA
eukprot:4830633-Amphidinium_carterae.1